MFAKKRLDLNGKVAVVTGGASGIGLAVCQSIAARGGTAVILDLNLADAEAAATQIGHGALGLAADVTSVDQLIAAFETVAQRLGGIDVVVANAGLGPYATTADAGDIKHIQKVLDVNLDGVWNTLRVASPYLRRSKGHLTMTSSVAAFIPTPSWAAYGVSKAGVEALSRSARIELAPHGVSVGVAHYGFIKTPLVATFRQDVLASKIEKAGPGFVTATSTPEAAGEATVDGIQRRAARTIFPSWWRIPYMLRGILGPITDGYMVWRIRKLMIEVDDRDRTLSNHAVIEGLR